MLTLAGVTSGAALAAGAPAGGPQAFDDVYAAAAGTPLRVAAGQGVVANDVTDYQAGRTVVRSTDAAHGSVTVAADGSFTYVPDPGFTGEDTFTYTVTDAVTLHPTVVAPLATIGGTTIPGGAFGSALTPVPGVEGEFYGLTDRGPNVDGPNGEKVEPLPDFAPAIGRFRLVRDADGTRAELLATIPLRAADGVPYDGQVNPLAQTGETIVDLDGQVLPTSPQGYDPEGLVALADGTFWVSDEYGPFLTHFAADGRALERLSPQEGTLPRELADRFPNRGMEGLTLTPDGRTLVGILQSALQVPGGTGNTFDDPLLRIVTVDLETRQTRQFAYLLDDPSTNSGAVSEITAVSDTEFLVVERDGGFGADSFKRLFRIDLAGASDISGRGTDELETRTATADTATAAGLLAAAGAVPVAEEPALDVSGLVWDLDPEGGFFAHDKIEGVATTDGGTTLVLANDSDFGISGVVGDEPPYQLEPKLLPDGRQDDGAVLVLDTTRLTDGRARTAQATVRVQVR